MLCKAVQAHSGQTAVLSAELDYTILDFSAKTSKDSFFTAAYNKYIHRTLSGCYTSTSVNITQRWFISECLYWHILYLRSQ